METKKTHNELHLPHELILQILLRLPVKSLLRFKCVCKSWFSLISDPHFATSYFEITTATHTHRLVFISNSDPEIRSVDFEASLHDDSAISVSHKLNLPPPKRCQYFQIIGSCRGIIVMRFYSEFDLWNPSTGVHKEVILSPNDDYFNHFGFGYDKSTDDYLLISMSDDYLEFFSLRANTWKQIESTHIRYTYLDHDYGRSRRAGLLFNGAIHWIACRRDHDSKESVIVAFDLMERKLLDMKLPHDFEPKLHDSGLWVFGEFLSLWSRSRDYCEKDTVEIWVMNEYKLSWTKKTIVVPIDGFAGKYLVPLCSTKSGDIVMTDNAGTGLAKYDGKGQLLEYLNYDNQGYEVALYIESLLSLHNE